MLLGLGSLVIVLSARRSWCKIRELKFVQLLQVIVGLKTKMPTPSLSLFFFFLNFLLSNL